MDHKKVNEPKIVSVDPASHMVAVSVGPASHLLQTCLSISGVQFINHLFVRFN